MPDTVAITGTVTNVRSVGWFNVRDFGAVGDASTDDTAAVQAAVDAATAVTVGGQQYGGIVHFPPGVYKIWGLQLKSRVRLIGSLVNGQGYREAPVRFIPIASPTAGTYMITQPAGNIRNVAIVGIAAYGGGATSTTGCMNLADVSDGMFQGLYMDNWGIEAAVINGTNCRFSYCFFQGLLNRASIASLRGAFTLTGADNQASHCEFTGPANTTVSSASLFCAAAVFNCYESEFDACVFQIGDIGLAVTGAARNRVVGCRFDSNAGHGLSLGTSTHYNFTGCWWSRNSFAADNTYDHINVVGSTGGSLCTFVSPMFNNNGHNVRWCINDAKNSDTFNNTYLQPYGDSGTTGFWSVLTGTVVSTRGRVVSKSANYTAVPIDATVLGTSGAGGITITLPSAVLSAGLTVKKVDAGVGALTVAPASGTIDGAANTTLTTQWETKRFVSNGTNWFLV